MGDQGLDHAAGRNHEPRFQLPVRRALDEQGGHRQDCREREQERAGQRECIGVGHRFEDPALHPLECIDRNERRHDDDQGEERGHRHFFGGLGDHDRDPVRVGPALPQPAVDVFDQDHGAVHDDSEIDRAHRDQVGRDLDEIEPREGRQQRGRDDDGDGHGPAPRTQEEPDDPGDQQGAFHEIRPDRMEGPLDEGRAVDEWDDLDARRQDAVVQALHPLADLFEHDRRVFPPAHQHEPFHGFQVDAPTDRALPRRVGFDERGDVLDADRRALLGRQHDLLDVVGRAEQPEPAHDVLLLPVADVPGADVGIGPREGLVHGGERNAVRLEPVGAHQDVDFFPEPALCDDIGDAGNLLEERDDRPVQERAEFRG